MSNMFKQPLLAASMLVLMSGAANGSSHREAPFITEVPKVDATDFYMFNSYEPGRDGYVTIVANYQPFQTPYGGPNYFQMDPDALYQVHIDNNGDAREDITFSFKFENVLRDIQLDIGGVLVSVPLYNVGSIPGSQPSAPTLNVEETYSLDVIYGDQYFGQSLPIQSETGETRLRKPADNVGALSYSPGTYEEYARTFITNIRLPGTTELGRVFVGQRKDPFVVNLGEAFDLLNLNPLGPVNGKQDSLADDNCTSLIIEVPASFLRGAKGQSIVGGWTTASLPRGRVLRTQPSFERPATEIGAWTQASRLGMPLVNELVVGLRDKNKFNNSRPRDDGQFLVYVTNPTLPAIIQSRFGVGAPCLPRNDLVAAFLTGVNGLNRPAGVVPGEMLRLQTNTSIIPVRPRGMQSELGVLGGDLSGFPNGRRPGDDVVDISLRVVMGVLFPDAGQPGGCAPGGLLPLTDGAFHNDQNYDGMFPYLRTPISASPQ